MAKPSITSSPISNTLYSVQLKETAYAYVLDELVKVHCVMLAFFLFSSHPFGIQSNRKCCQVENKPLFYFLFIFTTPKYTKSLLSLIRTGMIAHCRPFLLLVLSSLHLSTAASVNCQDGKEPWYSMSVKWVRKGTKGELDELYSE